MLDTLLSYINNAQGLYLLFAILPLIILYLIRPRPHKRIIPSLMFVIHDIQNDTKKSFFQRFTRDFLFLMQLFIILLFAASASHPYIETQQTVDSEYTVLVLDTSASSQARDRGSSRFDRMISQADSYLEGEITLILADNVPRVALENGKRSDAKEILRVLQPSDGLSAIGSSMVIAADLLKGKKGRVIVLSDFINTDEIDVEIAKKDLEARGFHVELIDLKEQSENVGITSIEILDDETRVFVHNYHDELVEASLVINEENVPLSIVADESAAILFKHIEGLNTIELDYDDALGVDNTAYVSIPTRKKIKVLVISNGAVDYFSPVFEAYRDVFNDKMEVEYGEPPILPIVNHDIVVLSDVAIAKLPKAVLEKRILPTVKDGGALIISAQPDIEDFKLGNILPVEIEALAGPTDIYNTYAFASLTEGTNFGSSNKHFSATPRHNAIVLAQSEDESPIIALKAYGSGHVMYYGVFNENNTFRFDVSYPLFWKRVIDHLVGEASVEDLNYRIGETVIFDDTTDITTPAGDQRVDEITFSQTGVYTIKNNDVAVNLLSETESSISRDDEVSSVAIELETSDVKVKKLLTQYFIIGLLVFLFLELLYIKIRGDL